MLWCSLLLWMGGREQAKVNLERHAPASGLPVAAMYGVGLFAPVCMGFIIVRSPWHAMRVEPSDEQFISVQERASLPPLSAGGMTICVFLGSALFAQMQADSAKVH